MNCPYCEQPLPKLKTYMHVCPYCHTITSKDLRNRALPPINEDVSIDIYDPPKEYLLALGKKRYETISALHNNIKREHRMSSVWKHILGFLFTFATIFFFANGDEGLCTVPFVVAFFIACLIFKGYQAYINKIKMLYSSDSNIPMPVFYYGNEKMFGIVAVPADCNDSNKKPPIERTEIPKSKIINIFQEDEQDPWVDIQYYNQENKIQQYTIPMFCSMNSLRKILGLNNK